MIHVIWSHPNSDSFTGDLARRVTMALEGAGMRVEARDLDDPPFPVAMNAQELRRKTSFESAVLDEMALVEDAHGLVILHPDWWGGPPALLKGWVDRVLRPGTAYEWEEGFGDRQAQGLLSGKKVLVSVTGDAPDDGWFTQLWTDRIWNFCGAESKVLYGDKWKHRSHKGRQDYAKKVLTETLAYFR